MSLRRLWNVWDEYVSEFQIDSFVTEPILPSVSHLVKVEKKNVLLGLRSHLLEVIHANGLL